MADNVLRTIGKYAITDSDVVRDMRTTFALEPQIRGAAIRMLVFDYCKQKNITVSDEELQKEADAWRVTHGLFKAADTVKFLETFSISIDDFERELEFRQLLSKLKDALFGKKVKGWFLEHQTNFDEVELRHLVVKDQATAQELRDQIVDDRVPFEKLAKQHSLDSTTKRGGGYLGWVRRGNNIPEYEVEIFGARPVTVLGPFKVPAGYELVQVLDSAKAKFSDEIQEEILDRLLDEEFIVKHLPVPKVEPPA